MSDIFRIEKLDRDTYNDQLYVLWEKINQKYPNGMYWGIDPSFCPSENTFLLLDSTIHNENGISKVIGKAQTIFFPKLEDDIPLETHQRILFHYRVLPEYEDNPGAVNLLYEAVVNRAMELQTEVQDGRKCKLCVSCTPNEHFYIQHASEKGFKETSGCYCMSVKKEKEIAVLDYEVLGIVIRDITKDLPELRDQIISNERNCFGDDVSEWETYQEFMNADFCIAYGAFDEGKLIGSVVADHSDGEAPEVESLMVLKEYRERGIAKLMLSKVMQHLKARSAGEIIIAVKSDNISAIKLYSDMGFEVYRNEMMYMKYM